MIAVFKNARGVIRGEALCRGIALQVTVVTVPEAISSECGMCLRVSDVDCAEFEVLMVENNVEFKIFKEGDLGRS